MADQDLWRKNLPEGWQGKMADDWDGEIPLKPIYWSVFAIALSVLIAFVLNIWFMETWDEGRASKVRVSPLAEAQQRFEHVNPKLQPKPEIELNAMKAEQEEHLASYGWVDPIERRVHIPVERAMEIVLDERGFSVVAGEALEPAPDAPVDVDPADAAADEHGDAGDH